MLLYSALGVKFKSIAVFSFQVTTMSYNFIAKLNHAPAHTARTDEAAHGNWMKIKTMKMHIFKFLILL